MIRRFFMVSINPIIENMSLKDVKYYSDHYLRGFTNLSQFGFKIAGLNKARKRYGFDPINASMVDAYRYKYITTHFSQQEIYDQIYKYMSTHRVAKERYALNGLELLDCAFRRTYVKQFKKLIGGPKFNHISEDLRVDKMASTQTSEYGGVGIGSNQTLSRALTTKITKIKNEMNDFIKTGICTDYLSNTVAKTELIACKRLVNRFGIDDVIYQYGSYPNKDDRYPYECDFYIKSMDLFIELNYHYSHGHHWFDPDNKKDQKTIAKWKQSSSIKYQQAAINWSTTDIKKRKIAKVNKLNYLVFWKVAQGNSDLVDFNQWLDDYKGNYKMFVKDHPENTY